MPRKQSSVLTDLELTIMNVPWERLQATTSEVRDTLAEKRLFAYTTLSTILTILTRKGYVSYKKKGKAYVYKPEVSRKDMTERAIQDLTVKFFNDSRNLLIEHLTGSSIIPPVEIEKPIEEITFIQEPENLEWL